MDEKALREELVYWGKRLVERGLVAGPGGNISARIGDFVLLSPSGLSFEQCEAQDFVKVKLPDGEIVEGKLRPTSETLMHLACYLVRDDIGAVVHTHPPYATGVASSGVELPPMFPDYVAYLGKYVPTVPYILPTTKELADAVVEKIRDSVAVLLENHGLITVGANLREAVYRTEIVEDAAKIFLTAKIVGKPKIFTEQEAEAVANLEAEDYRRAILRMEFKGEGGER